MAGVKRFKIGLTYSDVVLEGKVEGTSYTTNVDECNGISKVDDLWLVKWRK